MSLKTEQTAWSTPRTFAATATPGVTQRDKVTFEALTNVEILSADEHDNALVLRCAGTTANDTNVHDIYFMAAGTDHYSRVATLTWTTGTQTSNTTGLEFADAVVITNEAWHSAFNGVSPGNDFIAEVSVDLWGIKSIGLVPTTVANSLNSIEWRSA